MGHTHNGTYSMRHASPLMVSSGVAAGSFVFFEFSAHDEVVITGIWQDMIALNASHATDVVHSTGYRMLGTNGSIGIFPAAPSRHTVRNNAREN